MIFEGHNNNKILPDINSEIEQLQGHLNEEESRVALSKFLRANVAVTVELMTGIKLYPIQEMTIRAMLQKDFFLFLAARGFSKSYVSAIFCWFYATFYPGVKIGLISGCLDEDEYILTKEGIKKIKEVTIGEKVLSRYETNLIKDKWENPLEKGLKVYTKKDYSFKGKIGHKQLVYNPENLEFYYKSIEDLEIGDYLPIKINNDVWGEVDLLKDFNYKELGNSWAVKPCNIKVDNDLYYLFGQILGDGCICSTSKNSRCNISSADEETCSFVKDKFQEICPLSSIIVKKKDNSNCIDTYVSSNKFVKFLEHVGFKINTSAERKVIPSKILLSNKSQIKSFLQGLLDSDGNVYIQKTKQHNSCTIALNTSSIEIARTYQVILLNFGIISKLSTEKARGEIFICGVKTFGKESYKVRITGYDNLVKFSENIGLRLSRKNNQLLQYLNQVKNTNSVITVPGIGRYIRNKYEKIQTRDNLTYLSLSHILNESRITEEDYFTIKNLIEEGFYFDPITKIEECVTKSIDITVDKEECYFGMGFIHHNSFRQCLKWDSLIFTKDGLKLLDDLKIGEEVVSEKGINKILNKWENPVSDGIKIISQKGYYVEGKREHKILIYNYQTNSREYKEIKDLKLNDLICISKKRFSASETETFIKSIKILNEIFVNSEITYDEKSEQTIVLVKDTQDCKLAHLLLLRFGIISELKLIKSGNKIIILSKTDENELSDFYYDKVVKIDNVQNLKTIDIEVENEHCYWGQGFINHNSRVIFQYMEAQARGTAGTLLQQCISEKPNHRTDEWRMRIGQSEIIALPLGSTGAKLRGSRFNAIVIDELILLPEAIINEVILPFLSVNFDPTKRDEVQARENELIRKKLMKEEERTVFPNPKFIGLSSTGYTFEFLYKMYAEYSGKIYDPNPKDEYGNKINTNGYGIMQLSYENAPKNLYNPDTMAKFKSQMSEAQFNREFNAMFTDDSGGFFSKKKMDECTIKPGQEPTIEIKGDKDSKYILAIDPSFSKSQSSDHFAMGLLKLSEDKNSGTLVHNYAMSGGQLQDHMRYLLYLLQNFNIVYIIIDNAGHWFIDECNASVIFNEHNLTLEFFEADFENENYTEGLNKSRESYNLTAKRIVHKQLFRPEWIRNANERLAAAFDHKTIWFAAPALDDKYNKLKDTPIPIENLVYANSQENLEDAAKKADFIEHQTSLIDLVKDETALIEISTKNSGSVVQTFNLPQSLRRSQSPDKVRRDNYTTLLMCNWGLRCFRDLFNAPVEDSPLIVPFFIR